MVAWATDRRVFQTERRQIVVAAPGEHSLQDNFDRFHAENPHVYDELVRLARAWRAKRPGSTCGVKMLYEVCRWNLALATNGEPLRLNNNYHAFYARLIMDTEPDLEGIFETRGSLRPSPLSRGGSSHRAKAHDPQHHQHAGRGDDRNELATPLRVPPLRGVGEDRTGSADLAVSPPADPVQLSLAAVPAKPEWA